jgi:hypothetical protein
MEQEQKPTSPQVEFEENSYGTEERKVIVKNKSKMVDWLMEKAKVKTPKQANLILIGISVVFFLLSALVLLIGASYITPASYIPPSSGLESNEVDVIE